MDRKRRVTQQEIADILGVSRGTVVRALTNRSDINSATRRMIVQKATELGYVPNKLAQSLQRSRPVVIGVAIPDNHFFWRQILTGVERAREEIEALGARVKIYGVDHANLNEHFSALERAVHDGLNGLAIAALIPHIALPVLARAAELGVPVATINTDCPKGKRLFFVGPDDVRAGRLAANVLGLAAPAGGRVALVTLHEFVACMADRVIGFRSGLSERRPDLKLAAIETLPLPSSMSEIDMGPAIARLLRDHEPDGIYITYGGSLTSVAGALRGCGLAGEVKIVTHDLSPETAALIRDDTITATIGQAPVAQGYRSVMGLYRYAIDRNRPPQEIQHTRLDVILKENLDLHME